MALTSTLFKLYKRFSLRNKEITSRFCSAVQHANDANTVLAVREKNKMEVLNPAGEDLSTITPHFSNTFNLAAYVNQSETLKNLVDLNVNISKIEKKPYIVERFLKLDFEKDIKNHIIFLNNYIDMEDIGIFLTKNPMILCEPLQDLQIRVNYLYAKSFEERQIQRIIMKNPFWLLFSTIRIDKRLGFFQESLNLCGKEVRDLATKQPKLITYNIHSVKCNIFVIKEEMGFEDTEVKELVLHKPKLLMLNQRSLFERFNYIHNVMKISHQTIKQNPEILMCRKFRIRQRHLFLEKLGRSQYDPKKENYIPIQSLVEDSDINFCKNVAKCDINDFNSFLKTL
ncbi:transcription termination factor 3, mitochondrial [Spodoptera litura]|uniref:Transcription termination factor 3, mitochondrial n=1 Tax=Spodoptera litura TaxID=69820 RepID=A0A9J7E2H5_SPOLT|nr:transcription termination factor 3, mitochondrial [Spodoptera litura]